MTTQTRKQPAYKRGDFIFADALHVNARGVARSLVEAADAGDRQAMERIVWWFVQHLTGHQIAPVDMSAWWDELHQAWLKE